MCQILSKVIRLAAITDDEHHVDNFGAAHNVIFRGAPVTNKGILFIGHYVKSASKYLTYEDRD